MPTIAKMPTGAVLYRFRCMEDFFSTETKSQYVKGLTYSVRDGNEKLHKLVQDWSGQHKVEVL